MRERKHRGLALVIGIGRPQPAPGGNHGESPLPPEARRRQAADVEAAFLGRPQPYGTFDENADAKVPELAAGYMELEGARKDGECGLVAVPSGVSGARGCCNLFEPKADAQAFECASCEHFEGGAQPAAAAEAA